MSVVLVFKLLTTPALIWGLTWLVRRYGPAVGGLAMGVPLVTGPISVFTSIERGGGYAAQAAVASLVGQVSTCAFCFAYARAARRWNAWASAGCAAATFLVATLLWSQVRWKLWLAAPLLLVALALLARAMPRVADAARCGSHLGGTCRCAWRCPRPSCWR
ncbi:hypothetical protein [Sphingobium vermicomposti]|uniref:Uncharacterized protein n=1 Tax=Sphingobium vermicomposti TaxID=529005 RepID=A0A846MH26_9SPHN|nr:hypothetical protein [Sphingobium vermicomposti]NIJ17945.1 hypothetical protein [Sphingobium vermicomposti]